MYRTTTDAVGDREGSSADLEDVAVTASDLLRNLRWPYQKSVTAEWLEEPTPGPVI